MKKLYSFLVVLACLCFSKAHAQTADPDFHDGILSFKTLVDSSVSLPLYPSEEAYPYMDSLILKYGVTQISKTFGETEDVHLAGCYTVRFDSIYLADSFVQDIKQYGFIEFVSKRPIKRPFASPNDPKYNLQWGLNKIMADSVWNLLPGDGKEITLAVIDDAVLLDHEEFEGILYSIGQDMADIDIDVNPLNPTNIYFSHGTHVAGIALGKTNNGKGIASLNYNGNIKLLPVKVAEDTNPLSFINTPQAIQYAGNNGAKVVNMSFGSSYKDPFDSTAIATYPNVIFVAAAGNSGVEEYNYPASYNLPNIISVGATNEYDQKAVFSTYNDRIDIMAPGVGIIGAVASDTNAYNNYGGTSMTAPLVAGLCALLWSYDSMLTTQEVIDRVLNSADSIEAFNPLYAGKTGKGRINAYRAINPDFEDYNASFLVAEGRNHCTGETVTFKAIAYTGVKYFWDFGDGTVDSTAGHSPQHTYSGNGNYPVSLIIKDSVTSKVLGVAQYRNYIFSYPCNPIKSTQNGWYFGYYSGLNFSGGYPVADTLPAYRQYFNSEGGTVSVSDTSGKLLFYSGYRLNNIAHYYTNFPALFDKSHNPSIDLADYYPFFPFPNQGLVSIEVAGQHYVFLTSTDLLGNLHPLGYYPISFSHDGFISGAPQMHPVKVNNPNITFYDTLSDGEIITNQNIIAIPGCDSTYWLITQGFAPNLAHSPAHSAQVLVVKVEPDITGIKTMLHQVYSLPGQYAVPNLNCYYKASPDGNFIARVNDPGSNLYRSSTDIFKFDKQTGMISFHKRLGHGAGGVSFSPSGRFLYVIEGISMIQYDLWLEDPDVYATSFGLDNGYGAMQLGPDGKIYIAGYETKYLAVINFPDSLNTFENPNACGLNPRWPVLDPRATSKGSLPNMVDAKQVADLEPGFQIEAKGCKGMRFYPNIRHCDTAFLWYFGDGDSIIHKNPSHTYSKSGVYVITLINAGDTATKEVRIGVLSDIAGDTAICDTSYIYTYSVPKDDYYYYQWTATNGTILGDPFQHEIQAKFSQSGTLKVVVTDQRTGCVDSSTVHPTFGLDIQGNLIALDSQPCLAYLNGTTLTAGAGTTSYLWQFTKDTSNWDNLDTLEDMNWFVERDSLYFRRMAVNANCQSFSNTINVPAKPQIHVTHDYRNLICDGDSIEVSNKHQVSVQNTDFLPLWIHIYVKTASLSAFDLVDSFLYLSDTLLDYPLFSGDSMYFAFIMDCGTVKSRVFSLPNGVKNNRINVVSQPCFKGAWFDVSGTDLEALTPLSYYWELSTDTIVWASGSNADTLISLSADYHFEQDTFYLRRIVTDGACISTSNTEPVIPRVKITRHPADVSNCAGYGEAVRTFHLGTEFTAWSYYRAYLMVNRHLSPEGYAYRAEDSIEYLNFYVPVDSIVFTLGHLSDGYFFKIVTPCGDYHSDTAILHTCYAGSWNVTMPDTIFAAEGSEVEMVSHFVPCGLGPELEGAYTYWEYSANAADWHLLNDTCGDTLRFSASYCENGYYYRMVYFQPCGGGTENYSPVSRLMVSRTNFADLWMKDYTDDAGNEPNNTTSWENMDNPPDFWVRHNADGNTTPENVQWPGSNYVYYKIRNKGSDTSQTAKLYMHWTLGGINGQNWPLAWQDVPGNRFTNMDSDQPSVYLNTYPYGDSINTEPIMIPPVAPGDSLIGYFEWEDAPNPLRYYSMVEGMPLYDQELSLCMLARITTCDEDSFGMARKETPQTGGNVRNNNNIVIRNTKVINTSGVFGKNATRMMVRTFQEEYPIRLEVRESTLCGFMSYGNIIVVLNDPLWQAWTDGGSMGSGFTITADNMVQVTNITTFELSNIYLHPDSVGFIDLTFDINTQIPVNMNCVYYAAQYTGISPGNDGVFTTFLNITGVPVESGDMTVPEGEEKDKKEQANGTLTFYLEAANPADSANTQSEAIPPQAASVATVTAYPNPFSTQVNLGLNLPKQAQAGFVLYNAVGMKVAEIPAKQYEKGGHTQTFNGNSFAPGIYLCAVTIDGQTKTIKLILSK